MNLCRSPPRRDVAHELERPGPRNGRIDRGESTWLALMRAAENLIAERGIENVAVAHIVREAGQNNASALQCHFGRLQGIVEASRGVREAGHNKASALQCHFGSLQGLVIGPSSRARC